MIEATKWVIHILEAKFEKADLQAVATASWARISLHDKNKLVELLTKFEELFDRTLAD